MAAGKTGVFSQRPTQDLPPTTLTTLTVKWSMYGRASFALPRARILTPP